MAYIWLVYMVLPAYYILQTPSEQAVPGMLLLAVFAVMYVSAYRKWTLGFGFGLVAVTAALCFLFNPQMLTVGFYTVFLAAFSLIGTRRLVLNAVHGIMAAVVLLLRGNTLTGDEWINLIPALLIMFAISFAFTALRRTRELRNELDSANERIKSLIQQEERERIARDLHDTLGQTLTLISLKSELVEKLIGRDTGQAREEVAEIRRTARAALRQIRELVTDMRALRLGDEMAQAERVLASAGIRFVRKGDADPADVTSVTGHVLGFCLREMVTNVVRHSGATECEVELFREKGRAGLIVTDNGSGIRTSGDRELDCGNGLRNMQERLEFVGGSWKAETAQPGGTRIELSVPLAEKAGKEDRT